MNSYRARSVRVVAWRAKLLLLPLAATIVSGAALLNADIATARSADSARKPAAIALDVHAAHGALDRGMRATYTVSLRNRGDEGATGTRLVAPLPVGVDTARWTCASAAGAQCPRGAGSGAIDATIASLPADGMLLYTVDASVAAAPPPIVKNAVRTELPADATCADGHTPPCRAQLDLPTGARVDIRMRASDAAPAAGRPVDYTLTVRNLGNVDAAGTVVRDPVPFGFSRFDWTCAGSAPCPRSSGQGSLHEELTNFPAGSSLTYTINAQVAAQPPPRITHTATANPPYAGSCGEGGAIHAPPCVASVVNLMATHCGSAGPACPAAHAEKSLAAGSPSLAITQSAVGYDIASSAFTYVVDIANPAASGASADGTHFEIPVPAGIDSIDLWQCEKNAAPCTMDSGSGALDLILDSFQPGDHYKFTIFVTKAASPPPTITSTVTVTPPAPFVCMPDDSAPPCISQLSLDTAAVATLSLTTSKNVNSANAGDLVEYTVTLDNQPSGASANGTLLTFPLPAGIASWTWTCQGNGAECPAPGGSGALNETLASFPSGGSVAYMIDAIVGPSPPAFIETVATATTAAGVTAICVESSATSPCKASDNLPTVSLIDVQNEFSVPSVAAGDPINYTLRVTNYGAPIGSAMHISDPFPAGLVGITWTCEGSPSSVCTNGSSGSGAIEQDVTAFGTNDFIFYSVNATVATPAPVAITEVTTVSPPAPSVCGSPTAVDWPQVAPPVTAPPCVAEASVYSSPYLAVTKTADTVQLVPGGVVTYTVSVSNSGLPSFGARLLDPMPAGIDNVDWVCTSAGDALCPALSGSGDLDQTFGGIFPGNGLTYTLTAHVSQTATGSVINTATIIPDAGAVCDGSCAAALTLPVAPVPTANLKITKTANLTVATPGAPIVYTVTVLNNGAAAAIDTLLSDALPSGISSFGWTCSSTTFECPNASGSGALAESIPTLTGQVQYAVTALVSPSATGTIANTAAITPANGATCDQSTCSASASVPVQVPGAALINVVKTSDESNAAPGGQIHYTVSIGNDGASTSGAITVADAIPAGVSAFTWTCSASGTSCPAASGQGALNATLGALPAHASVVYRVLAQVSANASASIANTATASSSGANDCVGSSCISTVVLPIGAANVVVTSTSSSADGAQVPAGQPVRWTLTVRNDGAPTSGTLTITDLLPSAIERISLSADPGVRCTPAQPIAGQSLVCTIAAGFTGSAQIVISAFVLIDGSGVLSNSVSASGADQPACNACSTSHPITAATGVALGNVRPFSAAGINGSLFDVVNLRGAVPVTLTASPATAVQLFGNYASGCTTRGDGDNVVVSCPAPPPAQQLSCNGATCSIGTLAAGATVTIFVAAKGSAALTIQADVLGDVTPGNNSLQIPPPSGAP